MSELIQTIAQKTGLSEGEIREKIARKQQELSGLVSEEGATYIVANELGIKTRNRIIENTLEIKDILAEMRAVTVRGRVSNITDVREFTTKQGTKGKVANLAITDNTGTMRVVLWNMSDIEKVEKKEFKVGDIVEVKNGYVREGFRGGNEVHIGNRGTLDIKPGDADGEKYPEIKTGKTKIGELKAGVPVEVAGRVTHNFGINKFTTKDREGQVANLVIRDDSGGTRLVLWNEQAELANNVEIGDILSVKDAYTKEGQRGVEVQANARTKVERNPAGVELPKIDDLKGGSSQRVKIDALKEGDRYKELRGALVDIFANRDLVYDMCPNCNKKLTEGKCEKCGQVTPDKLLVINARIDDGSGIIRASFFRDRAEKLLGMSTEDIEKTPGAVEEKIPGLIGKEIILEGSVKKNEAMDRLEFNVFGIKDVNPAQEAEKIVEEVKLNE